ncbi:MAG: hypothetical protein O9248_00670 [Rhodobacteraceae bacterium]|nr:hypothetical protein [Paracoccaceae bacterium]
MDDQEAKDQIGRIIDFALGRLAQWTRPVTLKSVGPAHPGVFDDFERELRNIKAELRLMLETEYEADRLSSAFPESEASNPLFQIRGLHKDFVRRIRDLDARRPQGFVGGWCIKGREIDTAHWRGFPAYSIIEATLLSVGRDPRTTNFDYLFTTYGRSKEADELLYFLEDRQEQIARAFGLDPDDNDARVQATDFLNWANKTSTQIDERFRKMLRKYWAPKAAEKAVEAKKLDASDEVPHGATLKALAKIITAAAIRRYGLQEEKDLGRVVTLLTSDTELTGLAVNRSTVRKSIRLGWSLLPEKDHPT